MEGKFIGACPICSTQLERIEKGRYEGLGMVACPEGHFMIDEETFDRLWSEWGLLIQRNTILAQTFLELLESSNLLDLGDEK